MEPSVYDLTYNDLNPRFLFCCNLLNPGTYHQSLPVAGTSAREFYLAFSNVEFAGCTRGHFPLFKNYQLLATLPDSYKEPLFRLCNLMEQESKTCQPGRYFMLKSYLIQVIFADIRSRSLRKM